jgi:predicted phosphodiesterase
MRIAVVSDIHANVVALNTVLAAIGTVDQWWNLGDTIGYGPRPNECMAAMRERAAVMISGNHDLACIGKLDLSDFNTDARIANLWNGEQLSDEHRAFLEACEPLQRVDDRFFVAHGSPRQPVWEYLLEASQARANFAQFEQQVCFVGHSHVPLFFRRHADGRAEGPVLPDAGFELELKDDERYIINPGSVGQPRNHDPRAAYAILDTDANTVRFNRVEYDIAETQQQMREVSLPTALIRRLDYGM